MRSTSTWMAAITLVALALAVPLRGQAPKVENPFPYAADEPKATGFSVAKAHEYLDNVAGFWMQTNSCGACHANFAYVMARPAFGPASGPGPRVGETRKFLENIKPHTQFSFDAHAVAVAFGLAWDDARSGGKLQPATRQALARMWAAQQPNGRWSRLGCGRILPSENDEQFTVALAALAAGLAPENYARSPEAQDGVTKLRRYFTHTPVRNLHGRALLLWASLHLDGLLTTPERNETVQAILAHHGKDGGWNFAGLTTATPNEGFRTHPSDGYATGLAIYVLRQAGVPPNQLEITLGLHWLRTNQRVSGRWFTPSRSANDDTETGVGKRDLYVQNLGTAFALLALKACQKGQVNPAAAAVLRLAADLEQPDVSQRAKHVIETVDACDMPSVFRQGRSGGPGIGSAVQAGHKDSIDDLVADWSGTRPPTKQELTVHQKDLMKTARVLQAMAELAPHRVYIYVPKADEQKAQDWLRIAGEFKTVTRDLRHAIEQGDPGQTRTVAVRLQRTCNACHTLVGVR